MTADGTGLLRADLDVQGHHTAGGRNIAVDGSGLNGKDIFFAAVQMTRMPMCMSDPNHPDAPLVFANEAFQRMTGYSAAEIIGRNCRFLQGPDTDPDSLLEIRRAIAAREDVALELLNYKKDGTPFWNALYISPVFDADGQLIYLFGSQVDVTRRKQAEVVLHQSQRMEALGSMAAAVAHEFNNLMTIVIGSVQQAQERVADDRQHRQLERVEWAARQAGRLTQQMLSFARRQFHDLQATDLNQLLAETDSLLAQVVGPAIEVRLDLSEQAAPVWLDTGQFELALINLARNAADAMPEGGELTIATRLMDELPFEQPIAARDKPGPWVVLHVTDTGQGMPPEVMRMATEPFFTTKERGKGTGLGLSMVNGFAEQTGGFVKLDSAPDEGTSVTLVLPRRTGNPTQLPA